MQQSRLLFSGSSHRRLGVGEKHNVVGLCGVNVAGDLGMVGLDVELLSRGGVDAESPLPQVPVFPL